MAVLTQFALRLCFGLATAMALTSPRKVTSGFYRNQLYVLLGLNVLALLSVWSQPHAASCLVLIGAGSVLAYVGSVCWLYEKPDFGMAALVGIAGIDLLAAWFAGGAFS
ncbi:MAG: hypothetical protein K8T25_02415, partial [Planctomycetia bacterium]|nr:hypothetical protein [Planctomycetia bacterium]